jgi:hypothetical protein
MELHNAWEYPTVIKIQRNMREGFFSSISVRSVRRILQNRDFKFKKCNEGRQFLLERQDLTLARIKFLAVMNEIRSLSGERPVFTYMKVGSYKTTH